MNQMAFVVNAKYKDALEVAFQQSPTLENELSLHYQPKVNLKTGEIVGYEALIRWFQPDFGHVAPDRILEIAAFYGLTDKLNIWVVENACTALKESPDLNIAINLCPQAITKEFALFLFESLLGAGISPSRLQIEITEQNKPHDLLKLAHTVSWLRRQGITVALDDFGTGHATMEYLAKVDLDLVKIDKSYIEGIETDRTKRVTLMTVIDLIRTCDIQVLCEGVENEAQAKILKEMGVDYGQGYYFGKPVSMDDLTSTATPQSAKVLSMKR